MSKNYDQIAVVDVEATCWEGTPPKGQENEIIEIGICMLDVRSLARGEKESILVRPVRSSVSEFCTKLTTLTQQQVDTGIPFSEACKLLRSKFGTKDRPWASYGDYDRAQFTRQCQAASIGMPFSSSHINVKALLAAAYRLPAEIGMAEALAHMGLPLEGTHHRGSDDAWNIARILSQILQVARPPFGLVRW